MSLESLNRCYKNIISWIKTKKAPSVPYLIEKYNKLRKDIKKNPRLKVWIALCMKSFYEDVSKESLMDIVQSSKTVDEVYAFLGCLKGRKFELAHALIPLWEKMYYDACIDESEYCPLLEEFSSYVEVDFVAGSRTTIHSPWAILFPDTSKPLLEIVNLS